MKKTIKQLGEHRLLLVFSVISLLLFLFFSYLQHNQAKMLGLEVKWLAVAGVPILIGLFIGGYIKNLKGFGLELEYNLKKPLPAIVVSEGRLVKSVGVEKGTVMRLHQLSPEEKRTIDRLHFVYGRRGVYVWEDIEEHFKELENLKYIEVVDDEERFNFVIPASKFKAAQTMPDNAANVERIQNFIDAIENKKFNNLAFDAVTDFVLTSDSIIDAYRKIKNSEQSTRLNPKKRTLPVLNDKRRMVGTVDIKALEAKIAEEVEKNIGA